MCQRPRSAGRSVLLWWLRNTKRAARRWNCAEISGELVSRGGRRDEGRQVIVPLRREGRGRPDRPERDCHGMMTRTATAVAGGGGIAPVQIETSPKRKGSLLVSGPLTIGLQGDRILTPMRSLPRGQGQRDTDVAAPGHLSQDDSRAKSTGTAKRAAARTIRAVQRCSFSQ